MKYKLTRSISALMAGTMIFFALGCTSATVFIRALNAVVVTAEAAMSVLEQSGTLNATEVALVSGYLDAVAKASSAAATELASKDTAAEKAAKITADFASALLPEVGNLPPGIAIAIKAVNAAVQAFLNSIQPPASMAHVVVKPSMADARELSKIKSRADALHKKLMSMK